MATTWSFTVYPTSISSITINGTDTLTKSNDVFTTSNYSEGDLVSISASVGSLKYKTLNNVVVGCDFVVLCENFNSLINIGDIATIADFRGQNGIVTAKINGGGSQEVGGQYIGATTSITSTGYFRLNSTTSKISYIVLKAPKIYIQSEVAIRENNYNWLTLEDSSVNFDGMTYTSFAGYRGPIFFYGSSALNITPNSIGKTLISNTLIAGYVTLDVEDGVQDGDTFSIEATTNNLVITDGDWVATPTTVGNVTTYTLTKAAPKRKFRLLYTIDGGNKKLRFLGSKE